MYVSYGQFMIFDEAVELPGCVWTPRHARQGFARRHSVVNVSTLLDHGHAALRVQEGPMAHLPGVTRAIAVPFKVQTGAVRIEGPEELEVRQVVRLHPGHYCLTVAQSISSDGELTVDLWFDPVATEMSVSKILVAADALSSEYPLDETAEVAHV